MVLGPAYLLVGSQVLKATLGQLAALININERLVGLLYRPTEESLKKQLQDIIESPAKMELLFTLTDRLNRALGSVKTAPVEVSYRPSRDG